MIKIFVKGLADPAKKLGSYAFIAIKKGEKIAGDSEWFTNTTCNRMELQAILSALHAIENETDKIIIISESTYANTIFVTDTEGHLNRDILDEIIGLIKDRTIEVSRHSSDIDSETMAECKLSAREMMGIVKRTYSYFHNYLMAKVTIC